MDVQHFLKELDAALQTPLAGQTSSNPIIVPFAASSSKSDTAAAASSSKSDAAVVIKPVKLLIVSTHINQINGYSKVVHQLATQLAKESAWLTTVVFGTQKIIGGDIGRTLPSTVKVIDGTAMDKSGGAGAGASASAGFAFNELPAVILSEKPDVLLLYNDLPVICTYLESIRKSIESRTFAVWAYVDLCYQAPPQAMIDLLNRDVERVFSFTRGWKDVMKAQGVTRPIDVMPHAVDPKTFRYVPRDMARQLLGLPKDAFLFLSVNKNIPRKRLDLLVMAFTRLIVRFPTKPITMLIVGDNGTRNGFPLLDIFARELKIVGGSVDMFGNRLMITSKDNAYKDEDINMLYNAAEVGVSCAEGEGFGLCAIEQMATGVPQIVPELGGYTEYCTAENSLLVKPKTRYYVPQSNGITGEAQMVDVEDMARAMERYVFETDLRSAHGVAAKAKAAEYTWERAAAILVRRLRTVGSDDD